MRITRVAHGAVYLLFTIAFTAVGAIAWTWATLRDRLGFQPGPRKAGSRPVAPQQPEKQLSGR